MTPPRPDLWHPIAALLRALRTLLQAAAPEAFATIASEARARLVVLTALVRRYIHILAAEIILPPPRPQVPPPDNPARAPSARRAGGYLFPLLETPSRPGRGTGGSEDPPALQWALLMEAAARLAEVLRDPAPHARRLDPALDVLICRFDALARPEAWAGLDPDTS